MAQDTNGQALWIARGNFCVNPLIRPTPAIRGRRTLCGVPWMALFDSEIRRRNSDEILLERKEDLSVVLLARK